MGTEVCGDEEALSVGTSSEPRNRFGECVMISDPLDLDATRSRVAEHDALGGEPDLLKERLERMIGSDHGLSGSSGGRHLALDDQRPCWTVT